MNSEINFKEEICLICYEEFTNETSFQLGNCKHYFCEECTEEIVFNETVKCPLDNIECRTVTILRRNQPEIMENIPSYQKSALRKNLEFIKEENEENLSKYFSILIEDVEQINIILNNLKEKLNLSSSNDRNLSIDLIENISQLKLIYSANSWEHFDFWKSDKQILFEEIYLKNKEIQTNEINYMICFTNKLMDNFRQIMSDLKSNCKQLHRELSSKSELPIIKQRTLAAVMNQIDIICEVKKQIKTKIISLIRCNNKLYERIEPNFHLVTEEICLICGDNVNCEEENICYGAFPNCNHKICPNCIKMYCIICASCPFHNGGESLTTLQIVVIRTDQFAITTIDYFKSNIIGIYHCLMEKYEQISSLSIDGLLEIPNFKYLAEMIKQEDVRKLFGEDNEEIMKLHQNIKSIFSNIDLIESFGKCFNDFIETKFSLNFYQEYIDYRQMMFMIGGGDDDDDQISRIELERDYIDCLDDLMYNSSEFIEYINYSILISRFGVKYPHLTYEESLWCVICYFDEIIKNIEEICERSKSVGQINLTSQFHLYVE